MAIDWVFHNLVWQAMSIMNHIPNLISPTTPIDGYSPQSIVAAPSIDGSHPESSVIDNDIHGYSRQSIVAGNIYRLLPSSNLLSPSMSIGRHGSPSSVVGNVYRSTHAQRTLLSTARYLLCENSNIIYCDDSSKKKMSAWLS